MCVVCCRSGVHRLWDCKRRFHEVVADSGLDYTIINAGVLFETYFTPFFNFDYQNKQAGLASSVC